MALSKVVIEKIDIAAFGGVSQKSISFTEGVNLINADNECGKSTVVAAVIFALYGFYRQTRSISDNPKRKYMPWSGVAASVTLTIGGEKRLRIERTVSGNNENAVCTELATGLPMYAGKVFGEEILGIGAETAEKTLFFSTLEPHESKDEHLAAALQNLVFSADEQVSGEKAVKCLNSHKNALKGRSGGVIPRLELEELRLSQVLEEELAASEEYRRLEAETKQIKRLIAEKESETERAEAERENLHRYQAALLLEEHRSLTERKDNTDKALADFGKEWLTVEYVNECRLLADEEKKVAAECDAIRASLADKNADGAYDEGLELAVARCKRSKGLAFVLVGFCLAMVIASVVCFVSGTSLIGVALAVTALACGVLGLTLAMGVSNTVKAAGFSSLAELSVAAEALPRIRAEKRARRSELESRLKTAEESRKTLLARIAEKGTDTDGMLADLLERGRLENEKTNAVNALMGFESKYDPTELERKAKGAVKPEKSDEQIETEYRFATQRARMLREKLNPALARLEALRMNGADPSATEQELCRKRAELAEARLSYDALVMAAECLTEADVEMKASVSPRISEKASEYFSAATKGKYNGVDLDTRLYMSVDGESGVKSAEHLSAGARDMAYLCMRLALIRLIYGDSKVPLVLDDAFCRQDDNRLLSLIALLGESGHQLIVTSCTDREKRALEKTGADYTEIKL